METVRDFTYLGEMVSAGGGCETAVTARKGCGWIRLRECGELLYSRRFPLRLKRGCLQELCKSSNFVWK